jgi:hypothetical protein
MAEVVKPSTHYNRPQANGSVVLPQHGIEPWEIKANWLKN